MNEELSLKEQIVMVAEWDDDDVDKDEAGT